MQNHIPIFQVDAFSDEPFHGNPATVCILEAPKTAEWMQSIAAEMNLSETAFLLREGKGYHLRWFTPAVEVDLCGHATLASAHILWETGRLALDETAQFHTLSGLLTARRAGDRIELDFPARNLHPTELPGPILKALGVQPTVTFTDHEGTYLIELEDEGEVRSAFPDFGALKEIPSHLYILTCHSSTPRYDFISRVFAPYVGVNEDPVTGSAHCYLGPYWSKKMGKAVFSAYQASARGGELRIRVEGSRVILGGQAVTVLRGELV